MSQAPIQCEEKNYIQMVKLLTDTEGNADTDAYLRISSHLLRKIALKNYNVILKLNPYSLNLI